MILIFILDNQFRVFCPVSIMWDMVGGKILLIFSYVKHKQFDFSLLVNGKSIEKSISFNIIRVISNSFAIYKFFFFTT